MEELLESSRALWIYETQISLACQKVGVPLRQALQVISPPPGIIMAYGLKGGVPLKLSEQISGAASGAVQSVGDGIRNVASTTTGAAVAANSNVGKIMGRARRLLRWGTGRSNAGEDGNDNDPAEGLNIRKNSTEEWDIIDSIIDGGETQDKSTGPRSSSNTSASTLDSRVLFPDDKPSSVNGSSAAVTNSADDDGKPGSSSTSATPTTQQPTGNGLWRRFRDIGNSDGSNSDGRATPTPENNEDQEKATAIEDTQSIPNDDDANTDRSGGDDKPAATNVGFWNRVRRSGSG